MKKEKNKVQSTLNKKQNNANKKFTHFLDNSETAYNILGLEWNFKSVRYILEHTPYCFEQLATGSFFIDNMPRTDILLAASLCVESALAAVDVPASEIRNKADEIINVWMSRFPVELLWLYCITQIKDYHHFFIQSKDLKTVPTNSLRNLLKNLVYILSNNKTRTIHINANTGRTYAKIQKLHSEK